MRLSSLTHLYVYYIASFGQKNKTKKAFGDLNYYNLALKRKLNQIKQNKTHPFPFEKLFTIYVKAEESVN